VVGAHSAARVVVWPPIADFCFVCLFPALLLATTSRRETQSDENDKLAIYCKLLLVETYFTYPKNSLSLNIKRKYEGKIFLDLFE